METKSIFDLTVQQADTNGKIVVALERISEAFRVLLWEHGKKSGLTPIQIQILIFLKYHEESLCNVTYMAKEFNVSKPTLSDAVKALNRKGLIKKTTDNNDSRSYAMTLTADGKKKTTTLEFFPSPILQALDFLSEKERGELLKNLTQLVYKLNRSGIIDVQRTCLACRFYRKNGSDHYCNLLKKPLLDHNLRLDCPEFSKNPS